MNIDDAVRPMEQLIAQAIELAPRMALVILVLLVGLALSAIAGRTTRWLVAKSGLEALSEKFGIAKLLYGIGIKRGLARVLGTLVWFAGLLLTVSSAAELLGLPGMAQVTSTVVGVLPRFVIAITIAAVGLIAADLLRKVVRQTGRRDNEVDSPEVVAHLAYYAVVVVAFTTALEQAGIETGLINALVQILVAAAAVSVGLAFALGSRTAFQNVVARHYAQKMLRPGDHITIGDTAGVIVRYGAQAVLIRTENGERIVPCAELVDRHVDLERKS